MNYSQGKGRLYPAYSLSGSEGEENSLSLRGRTSAYPQNNHQTTQSHLNHYNSSQHKQRAYQQQQQHPLYHMPSTGAGLSDTPTSGNASDETLTDSDLITVARDSALLVHNDFPRLDYFRLRNVNVYTPRNYNNTGDYEKHYFNFEWYTPWFVARPPQPVPPSSSIAPGNSLGSDKSLLNEPDTCA
ncbi:uncharacterized protein LOC143347197 [Colletes latitarsis]|uniref:uncharacterized protein LOC143347197 n=1 Tax=Colletes latitarsis TaxID=2605962 RepID=UPI004035C1C9